MKHSSSRELFRYWSTLRGQRAAPAREEIDPSAMRRVLGDSFILSVESSGNTAVRLAGTRVCALFCREIKSTSFLQFWAPDSRPQVRSLLQMVMEESTAIVAGCVGETKSEPPLPLELLVLPLAQGNVRRARMIGAMVPLDQAYWIGTKPIETITLGTFRHIEAEAPARLRPRQVILAATPLADLSLVPSPPPRLPHPPRFVVYEGGAAIASNKAKIPAGE